MLDRKRIALSWSRLSDYQQCPLKFRLKYIDKVFVFDDKSPHLIRGSNIHQALENYTIKKMGGQNGVNPGMLPEVKKTIPLIDRLFTIYNDIQPEAQVAVNDQYKSVEWFSKDAFWRAIIDLTCIDEAKGEALVIDWKTGKLRDYLDKTGQLHLTALIIMMVKPNIDKIKVAFIYVDHKAERSITITRDEVPALLKHFNDEHARMNADMEFDAKPNQFCKYCDATKEQCPYSRKMA